MNEQELLVSVGQLAGRVGYPIPSIEVIDRTDTTYVLLKPRGIAGPVLQVRRDAAEIPPERLEFLIVQDLVGASFGPRHGRIAQAALWTMVVLIGAGTSYFLSVWAGLVALGLAYYPGSIGVTAVSVRIFQRRTDRRIAEVLGAERLAEALQELVDAGTWRHTLGWLVRGAYPQPPERLKWLRLAG